MKPASIQQIRLAVNGRALSPIPKTSPPITAVCTDTRRMEPGCLFIALRGENYDGHDYLPAAAAGGALAAMVEELPAQAMPNLHLLQVPDSRTAMGKLAKFVRMQMRAKIIAVAGSNGKTSTKHLIHAALCGRLKGSISPRSFNNEIGVPLTIFPADPSQDYLVLEIGTNHHGEIQVLTEMAQPDIAVITNCSAEHLEGLDDLMGVRRENASIIQGLNPKGLLVVNGDDRELLDAVSRYPGARITFGLNPENDLYATDIACDENGTTFRLNNSRRTVFVPMLGRHSALNALAAIAVARKMRVREELILSSLAEASKPEMRLQLQKVEGLCILNDAYNANPASMRAALETVTALPAPGRRIAIVGDMRELGLATDRYHREIGEFAGTCALDALICVGGKAALIAESAARVGMPSDAITHYPDARTAAMSVPKHLRENDLILLKASRGIRLELVAQAIAENRSTFFRKAAS